MARRFRGEYTQKVDGKGRVSIPSRYRRVIEAGDPDCTGGKPPEFIIVYGDERRKFLECYTIESMEALEDEIDALPAGSEERDVLETIYHGHSMEMSLDDTGRIVLSKKLRDKLGIEDEAFFIAKGTTFQVWKPETYDAVKKAKTEAWLEQQPEDFDPRILLSRNRSE
ncbi:division/cell wall cluster transcriptional repressor MraZ [Psychromarinibacter sp. C21-152]|uniref:Transcriptional regulator MraZ n=1 Tax=Psychromarinibacter sediminicola TaxID=3033385 RepID=A0AAE3T6X9_9RHOB|nr:division/cell wall cluster transcriptional repressor MraZ [Psychromarinibacter sediminicola]MDF0599737.1 division/cell wall cluster transcriptional repressor MraZ [Psychromarinibacter sediminicola]